MYQIILDTNVLVAAARSRRGSSYALLQTFRSGVWQLNVSSALLLEYEAQLKAVAIGQGRPLAMVDRFLDFLLSRSNRRQTFFLLRPFLRDAKEDFIIELAVASRADYIITWNVHDFAGASDYVTTVIRPSEFLTLIRT